MVLIACPLFSLQPRARLGGRGGCEVSGCARCYLLVCGLVRVCGMGCVVCAKCVCSVLVLVLVLVLVVLVFGGGDLGERRVQRSSGASAKGDKGPSASILRAAGGSGRSMNCECGYNQRLVRKSQDRGKKRRRGKKKKGTRVAGRQKYST